MLEKKKEKKIRIKQQTMNRKLAKMGIRKNLSLGFKLHNIRNQRNNSVSPRHF